MSWTIEKHIIPGEGGGTGPPKADNQDSSCEQSEDSRKDGGKEPYAIYLRIELYFIGSHERKWESIKNRAFFWGREPFFMEGRGRCIQKLHFPADPLQNRSDTAIYLGNILILCRNRRGKKNPLPPEAGKAQEVQ